MTTTQSHPILADGERRRRTLTASRMAGHEGHQAMCVASSGDRGLRRRNSVFDRDSISRREPQQRRVCFLAPAVAALCIASACGGGPTAAATNTQPVAVTNPTASSGVSLHRAQAVPAAADSVATVENASPDPRLPHDAAPALQSQADHEALMHLGAAQTTSMGGPMGGALLGGVPLPLQGPGYIGNPRRRAEARYGTVELLQAIVRAAADSYPGGDAPPLVVNDLSLAKGGPITQHGSHQSGRDADILFFVRDLQGAARPSVGVPLAPDGSGVDFRDLADPSDDVGVRLDVERTWHFMEALLKHGGDDVQRIFIAEHLRTLLLTEAKRQKAPAAMRERFAMVTCQPGSPHDDHMHVRFHCTAEDMKAGCRDTPPVYPFRKQQLADAGLSPQLVSPKTQADRKAAADRTTTPEQARKAAGPMHNDVVAFLDARKAWLRKTTPPRPYCK